MALLSLCRPPGGTEVGKYSAEATSEPGTRFSKTETSKSPPKEEESNSAVARHCTGRSTSSRSRSQCPFSLGTVSGASHPSNLSSRRALLSAFGDESVPSKCCPRFRRGEFITDGSCQSKRIKEIKKHGVTLPCLENI
jgi:hypothetical protein